MLTLFLDMDGVLADFDTPWEKFLKENNLSNCAESFRIFTEDKRMFSLLKQTANFHGFMNEVEGLFNNYDVNIEILSCVSPQNPKHKAVCREDKAEWLLLNGLGVLDLNVVKTKYDKAKYATPNTFLIDDNPRTVAKFIIEGGGAHTHVDANYMDSIKAAEEWIVKRLKETEINYEESEELVTQ